MKNCIFLKSNVTIEVTHTWKYWCNKNDVDLIDLDNLSSITNKVKNYNKIGVINDNILIKWDAPNIFNLFEEDICGTVDTGDFKKILNNKNQSDEDIDTYLQTDVLFFNSKYSSIIETVSNNVQLDINNNINKLNKNPKLLYPCWNLYSIHIKDMFKHNWQLNNDPTPFFIKYAYIWNFNDIPNHHKDSVVKNVWQNIKEMYKL